MCFTEEKEIKPADEIRYVTHMDVYHLDPGIAENNREARRKGDCRDEYFETKKEYRMMISRTELENAEKSGIGKKFFYEQFKKKIAESLAEFITEETDERTGSVVLKLEAYFYEKFCRMREKGAL